MALGSENQHQFSQQQLLLSRGIYQTHQRPIAPAPNKHPYGGAPYTKPNAGKMCAGTTLASNNPAVIRRNARERNRVKQVNNGFTNLRQHIPVAVIADLSNGRRGIGPGANKKLSKVDTLRMAVEYIRRLKRVIDESDGSDTSSVRSFNSCDSSSSGSPPPSTTSGHEADSAHNFYSPSQTYYGLSYAGSFQQHSSQAIVSPAGSTSSAVSSDSAYGHRHAGTTDGNSIRASENYKHQHLKFEHEAHFEDYGSVSHDEDDLLDYISLWQDDL